MFEKENGEWHLWHKNKFGWISNANSIKLLFCLLAKLCQDFYFHFSKNVTKWENKGMNSNVEKFCWNVLIEVHLATVVYKIKLKHVMCEWMSFLNEFISSYQIVVLSSLKAINPNQRQVIWVEDLNHLSAFPLFYFVSSDFGWTQALKWKK